MLTQEQLDILKAPFVPGDVSFKQTYAYGTEDAIADRIEMVDPSWTFERLSIEARDKYVVATFRLTICGVWRDGVGMELLTSQADPDKSAATDALKRAARLFGVGRYFQTLPDYVKDWKTYESWYYKQFPTVGIPTQQPPPPSPQPPIAPPPAVPAENGTLRIVKGDLVEVFAPPPAVQKKPFSGQPASAAPAPAENGANGVPSELAGIWNNVPSGGQWQQLRTWLLAHVYEGNRFTFDGSFAKRAKETNSWKRGDGSQMTVGNIVTFLQTRHDGEKAGLKETA